MTNPVLLTDDQMQHFIAHGFLRLQTHCHRARISAFSRNSTSMSAAKCPTTLATTCCRWCPN